MNKLKTILLGTILFIPVLCSAQEKKNILKTSLVFPFTNNLLVAYERMVGVESSVQAEVVLGNINSLRLEYRYYLSETRQAPSGAFISPYGQILDDGSNSGIAGGLLVGYQRLFKEKISLEAFVGPGLSTEGVTGWAGINIGFAF